MAKHSTLGRRLIASLSEAVEAAEKGTTNKITVRTVKLPPKPDSFDAVRVKSLRESLGVSQAVFAAIVGVSAMLIRGWEQGVRKPSPLACRLLGEIERNPGRWRRMVA